MKRFDHEIIRPRPIDAVDCTICAQWRRAVQHLDPYTAVDTQDSMDSALTKNIVLTKTVIGLLLICLQSHICEPHRQHVFTLYKEDYVQAWTHVSKISARSRVFSNTATSPIRIVYWEWSHKS